MPYAELRGTIYWFRRRAPAPFQPGNPVVLDGVVVDVGKNGYVRFSLKTSDRRKARQLALKYAHQLDEAAARLAQMTNARYKGSTQSASLSPEEIQHAADTMYAQLLAADETVNVESVAALMDGSEDPQDIREPDRHHWSVADLPPVTAAGQVELLRQLAPVIGFFVLQATGKLVEGLTPDLLPFADAFRRYIAALERRKASELVPTPELPSREQALWSWEDALNYYYKQRGTLAKKSKDNYRTAWNSLAAHAKGSPAKLKDAQVVTWKDDLLARLEARTVKTRLTFVKAIWMESRVNGKIPKATPNPFEGLRVKVPENVDTARVQFELEELETIFASPPVQTESSISVQAGYCMNKNDIEREGSTLLAMLYAKARADGLQAQELATEKLGVHPSYLGQLRTRAKHVENISHDFAEACAKYLGIPLVAVLVAAGQLKEQDFREAVDDGTLLRQAVDYIMRDPVIGPIIPPSLLLQTESIQRAFVLIYERAMGKKLLGGRLTAGDLAVFAKAVPQPFKGYKRVTATEDSAE